MRCSSVLRCSGTRVPLDLLMLFGVDVPEPRLDSEEAKTGEEASEVAHPAIDRARGLLYWEGELSGLTILLSNTYACRREKNSWQSPSNLAR